MAFDVGYGITRRLGPITIDDARPRVTAALAAEGFGVITEIDMQATLEKKLGVKRPPYLILGACNPTLANRGLGIELAVGLFLPCNVVLAEDDGEMVASAVSPRAMFASIVPRPEGLDALADEVEEKLRRAIAAI